ncbi:hypothetical protein M1D47_03985 [Bacillus sp. R1-10]
MLNIAFEENETAFFEALYRIHAKLKITFNVVNAKSLYKFPKHMQRSFTLANLEELATLAPYDVESCHLIAYTLKLIEVNPSPKHFKGKKIELKKTIAFMIQTLEDVTSELFAETRNPEYLEAWGNAKESALIWKKIIKLYEDIYNPSFDSIWK